MYQNHSVGVVVPAYNEAAFVGDVARDLPEFVDAVYLVDDASTDETWTVMGTVLNAQRTVPVGEFGDEGGTRSDGQYVDDRVAESETAGNVTRLRHRENRGAGGAVKTGYLAALKDGVDVVATIDGDGQMDSAHLRSVVDPVVSGQAGYAKGNRFAGTDAISEMPPFRLFGNVLLTGLTRIASGYLRLSDPQNGYTAISRRALLAVDVEEMKEYYGYMNHLMAKLNVADVRIADVPMPATYGDEESHIEYREYIRRVSGLLLASFLQRLWEKYGKRGDYPVLVGYVGSGLVAAISVLWWTVSNVAPDVANRRWSDAIAGIAVGFTLLVAAVILDGETDPFVVDVSPPRPEISQVEPEGRDGD